MIYPTPTRCHEGVARVCWYVVRTYVLNKCLNEMFYRLVVVVGDKCLCKSRNTGMGGPPLPLPLDFFITPGLITK